MIKSVKYSLVGALLLQLSTSCEDQKPQVIIAPEPPQSPHVIDQYYHFQFVWGKGANSDTFTFQEPDTAMFADTNEIYIHSAYELKSEAIQDTAGDPPNPKIGWHYAPGVTMWPGNLIQALAKDNVIPEEIDTLTRKIPSLFFSHTENDTLQYWDIQDYLNMPAFQTRGSVPWGRTGDSEFLNIDARDGVVISFIDENGEEWRTDNHPTFQPNSYFEVKSVLSNRRDELSYYIIIGEFAARLYNSVGYHKDARAGKFRLRILTDIPLSEPPS